MADKLRAVIIGASTLLGKELIEELNNSTTKWELTAADAADSAGRLVAAAEEPFLIQPLTPDVFEGKDVAFFVESVTTTRAHWLEGQRAKAAVVDLTGALENERQAIVRCPWVEGGRKPDSRTAVICPAHPAAVMLGVVGSRILSSLGRVQLAATVLEPASQQGTRGMDELHRQTVSLLGFHALPQELYGRQVAFNLQISLSAEAQADLGKIANRIRHDVKAIAGDSVASAIAIQLVQAPVFHGYTMSVFAELPESVDAAALQKALQGGVVKLEARGDDAPSNQSVAQEADIMVAIREDVARRPGTRAYWLWMAVDNLKLTARNAVACAEELSVARARARYK